MAGSRSIRARVLDDVERTLKTWGDSVDHHHRMVTVERFRIAPPDPTRLPACIFYGVGDVPAPEGQFLPYEYRYLSLVIEAWVPRPTGRDWMIDHLCNELIEDCYRVMMQDPMRSGWALETVLDSASVMVEENVVGAQITFYIKYRFLYQNPSAPIPEGMA